MVVYCTYCGRSFTRDEHLDRHIRTHTNVKPFKCLKCYLGFSRSDLLQRHMRFHDRNFVSNHPTTLHGKSKSQRTPIACQNCAASKTKCDTLYPCKRCTSKNLECVVRQSQRAGRKRSIPAKTSKTIQETGKPIPLDFNHHKTGLHKPFEPFDDSIYELSVFQTADETNALCTNPDLGVSDFGTNSREIVHLERILSAEVLPDIIDNIHQPIVDSISIPLGDKSSHHPKLPARNTPSSDNIDLSSELGSLPATGIPTQNEDQEKDFILYDESEDYEILRPPSCLGTESYSDNSSSNIAEGAQTINTHLGLENKVFFSTSLGDNMSRAKWSKKKNITQDLFINLLDSRQETLLKILKTTLDALSRFGSDIPLEFPHIDNYSESLFESLSLPEHGVLDALVQTFVSGFDQMFPLLQQSINGNLLSDNNTLLDNLFSVAIITQSISCIPCSKTVSRFSRNILDGCRTYILATIKTERSSGNDEAVLHLCLIHTYHLLWVSAEEAVDKSLENYDFYSTKVRNTYLRGHGDITQEQSIALSLEDPEIVWEKWKAFEKKKRLLYCWVILDLEASLLCNRRPCFEIPDLIMPLPDTEDMWHASSASQWRDAMLNRYPEAQNLLVPCPRPASLVEVFQSFVDDFFLSNCQGINVWQLRLLLYPLHKMIDNCNQLRKDFIESGSFLSSLPRRRFLSHVQALLDETRILLEKWHQMASSYLLKNPECLVIRTSIILYHILFLETLAYYPFVHRVCQQHVASGTKQSIFVSPLQIALSTSNHGLMHCVSILDILEDISIIYRPKWWPLAICRAGFTLWTMDHSFKSDTWNCNKCFFSDELEEIRSNAKTSEKGASGCRKSTTPVVDDVLKRCVRMLSEDIVSPEVQQKREQMIKLLII